MLRSFQLPGEGLEHIFAGGDMCSADNFSHGERTSAIAAEHAMAITQNVLLLAGRREGKLKKVKLNEHPGLGALAVSLGNQTGLLYATDPALASFFGDAEALRAEFGEMSEAGKAGWKELTPKEKEAVKKEYQKKKESFKKRNEAYKAYEAQKFNTFPKQHFRKTS